MFFGKRIISIRPEDNVLEIGPGATPYIRANEFLEHVFADEDGAIKQRADIISSPDFGGRNVISFSGMIFPFDANSFDYVIASQVIEHTEDPAVFVRELNRVSGGRGYIEFPLPTYEYLFDFDVHRHFVWVDHQQGVMKFVKKVNLDLGKFASVTALLRRSLELGWDDVIENNLEYFFVGFEFDKPITIVERYDLSEFHASWQKDGRTLSRRISRKVGRILE